MRPILTVISLALLCFILPWQDGYAAEIVGSHLKSQIKISMGSTRFNKVSGKYEIKVKLTNVSRPKKTLYGPIALKLNAISRRGVTLQDASGADSDGKSFVLIPLNSSGLTPRQAIKDILLRFNSNKRKGFTVKLKAYGFLTPNQQPIVTEPTPLTAIASVAFNHQPVASDSDGGSLRFSLLEAPAGMSINSNTGNIQWTPLLEQVGNHVFTLKVQDQRDSVVSLSYSIKVAAPAGFSPFVKLNTHAESYAGGQPVRINWEVGGDISADTALQIKLRAPGIDPTNAASQDVEWTLNGEGAWSANSVNRQAQAADGAADFVLPTGVQGNWHVDAILLDGNGKRLDQSGKTFLVSSIPSIHLSLNRPIANALDQVRVKLIESAGDPPRPVRVLAWLVKPDGSVLGLPSLDPQVLEIHRGDSANAAYQLLDQAFTTEESGPYRIHGRLYDAVDGHLLQDVSTGFMVCDTPATLSGSVNKPDGTPLNGSVGLLSTVTAFDLDDKAGTTTHIAADGHYTLSLPPGRYVLTSRHIDATQLRYEMTSDLVTVDCNGLSALYNFTLNPR